MARRNQGGVVARTKSHQNQASFFSPINLGVSLLSVLAILAITLAVAVLFNGPYYYNYFPADPLFRMVILILVMMLYVASFFGPAFWLARHRGWDHLAAVIVLEIMWLIFFVILYAVFFGGGVTPPDYPIRPLDAMETMPTLK